MATKLFDGSTIREGEEMMDFMANLLEALRIPSSEKTSMAIFCCLTKARGSVAKRQAWSETIPARKGDEK